MRECYQFNRIVELKEVECRFSHTLKTHKTQSRHGSVKRTLEMNKHILIFLSNKRVLNKTVFS